MQSLKTWMTAALLAVATIAWPAHAGEGHDHGEEAPASATGPALPRFAASSELFELVGVVDGKNLALYLGRFDDNSPVSDARLELEIGGQKLPVAPHAPGEYEAVLPSVLAPGLIPVTVTVLAQGETDMLAGEIDIHEEAHSDGDAAHGWERWFTWAGGAAVLAAVAVFALRTARTRRLRTGGAA